MHRTGGAASCKLLSLIEQSKAVACHAGCSLGGWVGPYFGACFVLNGFCLGLGLGSRRYYLLMPLSLTTFGENAENSAIRTFSGHFPLVCVAQNARRLSANWPVIAPAVAFVLMVELTVCGQRAQKVFCSFCCKDYGFKCCPSVLSFLSCFFSFEV